MRLSKLPIAWTCKRDLEENGFTVKEPTDDYLPFFALFEKNYVLYDANGERRLGYFHYNLPGLSGWYLFDDEPISPVRDRKARVASFV